MVLVAFNRCIFFALLSIKTSLLRRRECDAALRACDGDIFSNQSCKVALFFGAHATQIEFRRRILHNDTRGSYCMLPVVEIMFAFITRYEYYSSEIYLCEWNIIMIPGTTIALHCVNAAYVLRKR